MDAEEAEQAEKEHPEQRGSAALRHWTVIHKAGNSRWVGIPLVFTLTDQPDHFTGIPITPDHFPSGTPITSDPLPSGTSITPDHLPSGVPITPMLPFSQSLILIRPLPCHLRLTLAPVHRLP